MMKNGLPPSVKITISIALAALCVALGSTAAMAQSEGDPVEPIETRDFLCAPRLQLRYPERCPHLGPGAVVTDLARQGLYPPRPLPVVGIDPNYSYLATDYLRAKEGPVLLYPSAEAAAGQIGAANQVYWGFVYLSYYNELEVSGSTVFATAGGYVRGDQVSRVDPPRSPGLQFSRTPDRPFGWITSGGTCSQKTPGGAEDWSGTCYVRHHVVQVYDVQHVGDWDWYKIGIDEWVEQRFLAVVTPDPTRPEGVEGDRWIRVDLYEQTVTGYEGGQLVFATVASTGRNGFWTKPGTFQVWAKLERDHMTGGVATEDGGNFYYLEDVPWVLYFDKSRALHGTYWHAKFGTPTSRGCVNLAPADARWIFEFSQEGTWVHVWDPSGSTPTDPELYGPGGA